MFVDFEVKSNCGRYTQEEMKKPFHFFGVTHDTNSVYQNSVVFTSGEMADVFGSFINANADKQKRYQVKVFRWTCENGEIKNACAGKKSETRVRDFLAEHCPLSDFFGAIGVEMTAQKFNALYREELEKRDSYGDNSSGKAGDAYEQTIRKILNPRNKYRNAVHAPSSAPDIRKRWSADMLEHIGRETGLYLD